MCETIPWSRNIIFMAASLKIFSSPPLPFTLLDKMWNLDSSPIHDRMFTGSVLYKPYADNRVSMNAIPVRQHFTVFLLIFLHIIVLHSLPHTFHYVLSAVRRGWIMCLYCLILSTKNTNHLVSASRPALSLCYTLFTA